MEFGALGALLASALIVFLLRAIKALPGNLARPALASAMALGVVATTGYGLWQGWWIGFFFLLIAYVTLLQKQYQEQ